MKSELIEPGYRSNIEWVLIEPSNAISDQMHFAQKWLGFDCHSGCLKRELHKKASDSGAHRLYMTGLLGRCRIRPTGVISCLNRNAASMSRSRLHLLLLLFTLAVGLVACGGGGTLPTLCPCALPLPT